MSQYYYKRSSNLQRTISKVKIKHVYHRPFVILNLFKPASIKRMMQVLQMLYLDGNINPTNEQISKNSGMSIAVIKKRDNQEIIEIIKFAIQKYTNSRGHIGTLYMYPNNGILLDGSATVNPKFIQLGGNNWIYNESVRFSLFNDKLTIHSKVYQLPTRTMLSNIERVCILLGLEINNDDSGYELDILAVDFKELLSVLVTLALKQHRIIGNNLSQLNQLNYGFNLFNLYLLSVTGTGRIKSENKYLRWLNEEDTLNLKSDLFNLSGKKSYKAGSHSMAYEPTSLFNAIIRTALSFLEEISFTQNNELILEPLDFVMNFDVINVIKLQDVLMLLNDCVGYQNGFVIRPTPIDQQFSRVYSCFTSISSNTRRSLGFINYDIGAALQSICLGLIDNPTSYPLHQELRDNKHSFRAKIMAESGKDLEWVKTKLSELDNKAEGLDRKYNQSLLLYYQEAIRLRKDVIETIESKYQEIYARAILLAKPKFKKQWNDKTKQYDFVEAGLKESSIFFFIWTQFERQIREEMMRYFSIPEACHQVHDAVYTREFVDTSLLEQFVLDNTGFKISISN